MTDILDTAIEELKQEKIYSIIRKYAKFLIILILIALICGLAFNWWKSYKENNIHAEAAEYIKIQHFLHNVINKDALAEGLGKLEKLSEGDTIYANISAMHLAHIHDAMGNFLKASSIYKRLSETQNIDPTLKDFSDLMYIASHIRSEKITDEEAIEILHKSLNTESFMYSKQLLEASLLINTGKKDEASALLNNMIIARSNGSMESIPELLLTLTH